MSVSASDLVLYKSSSGASAGGTKSATVLTSAVKNDLWPDISDASRVAGGTRTKKWFLANDHVTDTLFSPSVYIALSATGVTEQLGLGFDSSDDADSAQGNMTAWTGNAVVALVSSGSDTRTASIWGIDDTGFPNQEDVVLAGTGEVVSGTVWSKVWGIKLSATNGSNTVTVKQGSGGTTRGTIGINKISCFLWVTATTKATGIILVDMFASTNYGFWHKQTWPASTASARPTESRVAVEETA